MDAIYYMSGTLMTIVSIGLIVITIIFLIKPHLINERKVVKKPFSRQKIFTIGLVSVLICIFGFSSVLAATEPASVKQARAAEEASRIENERADQQNIQQEQKPVVEVKTETKKESVPFDTIEKETATLNKGESEVSTDGIKGEKTITYSVTYTDGIETGREKLGEEITKQPVDKIISVGTYVYVAPEPAAPSSSCDPNYSGCVPIASDVDCAGGSGNGPAYVSGPVNVIGYDKYDLDRDNDGIACE